MSTVQSTSMRSRPNRQQVAAAATRLEILQAARRLFGRRGYGSVSIAEIAESAGVSIPTIYASVGTKPAIILALLGICEQEAGTSEARSRIPEISVPDDLIALCARVTRDLHRKCGDITAAVRSAAQVEAELAVACAGFERTHRDASRAITGRLAELDALKPGVDADGAAVVVALLTGFETWVNLVDVSGWSHDRAEAWIRGTLKTVLLRSG